MYRINRSGSFRQADRWQQWNATQIRRTETAPEARSESRGTLPSPEQVPTIGQLDMDVDSYFKRYSRVSDSTSITTTDTLDSIPERSNGDVVDHMPQPNIAVELECGTENGADVASQSSLSDPQR